MLTLTAFIIRLDATSVFPAALKPGVALCSRKKTRHHWATVHRAACLLKVSTQHDLDPPTAPLDPNQQSLKWVMDSLHLWSGREEKRGGFWCIKIEPEPGGAGDWDLMRDAIINYSKHLIMVSRNTVAQTYTCTHTARETHAHTQT